MNQLGSQLQQLNARAMKILATPHGFWQPPESSSPLLVDLHREFSLHWLTCTRSMTSNVTALVEWNAQTSNRGTAVALVVSEINSAMVALEAPTVDRFIDLSFVIAESVAKLAGAQAIVIVLDAKGLWAKIKSITKLGKPDLTPLDTLLPKLELAMEQMMLAALFFEMTIDRLTRQSGGPSDIVCINDLKKPVIDILQNIRKEMDVNAGAATRVVGVEEGFWPPGLRGDVPDVDLKRQPA